MSYCPEFVETYNKIGVTIGCFGGPQHDVFDKVGQNDGKFGRAVKRDDVKGSPVIPGSRKKVFEEGENVLYAITVLKGHYSAGFFEGDVFQAGMCSCHCRSRATCFYKVLYTRECVRLLLSPVSTML